MNEQNSSAGAGQTKLLIAAAIAVLIGAAAWYGLANQGDSAQKITRLASAEHTIASASITHLDASYRRVLRALRAFPTVEGAWSMLWDQPKNAKLTFDPSKAETWTRLGIDPHAGAAIVLDARLVTKDNMIPLIWLATGDLEPSIKFLAEWSGHPMPVVAGKDFKSVVIGDARMLFAAKGDVTVLTLVEAKGAEPVDATVERLKLAQVLDSSWSGNGPSLAESKRYKRALSDSVGEAHITMYLDFENLRTRINASKEETLLKPAANYITRWIEASALRFGDQGSVGRVVTTTPGQTLLEQLFSVKSAAPKFSRRIQSGPWSAVRWSINLKQILDGISQALPPTTPDQVRMGIGMARMALPMATGISWEALCRAFTGNFMLAMRPGQKETDPAAMLFAAQIADGVAADGVLATAAAALAKRAPGAVPQQESVAGVKGWTLTLEGFKAALVRHEDMLLFGGFEAVEEAIKATSKSGKTPAEITDMDTQALLGVLINGRPLIPKELAKTVVDDRELMAFATAPFFSMTATLDNRGLLISQTRPARIEDLLAFLSSVPSISLPFQFPVSL